MLHALLFLSIAGVALLLSTLSDGKVMMEYIGATGVPVSFNNVPIDPSIEFYFLLSFAIDSDPSGNPQNGKFSPYWSSDLTPSSVASLKSQNPNVKVLASLSGWSINTKVLSWYKPESTSEWISNAFTSLQALTTQYHLDGIDIDYENFPINDTSFGNCIGELFTRLKQQNVATITSIAPYHKTVDQYVDLFQQYGDVIDYVNYQFYTDRVRYPALYLEAFRQRAGQFDAAKLLPSYEIDGRGIQGDAFFDALRLIESKGFDVNGIMIFSADASQKDGFSIERKSQAFLLSPATPASAPTPIARPDSFEDDMNV